MKKFLVMICLATFSVTFVSAQAGGKKPLIVQDVKATKVDAKQRGSVIKSDVPTTDVEVKATTRGSASSCDLSFDNYTGFWIKIYVDGNFKGYVEPYGKGDVSVGEGFTTYYCETAGGTYYWSGDGNCSGYNYIKMTN